MGLFKEEKSLSQLQEQDEHLDVQLSVARKRALLNELKEKSGSSSFWKLFSDNGSQSGLNFSRIIQYLKTH
jgi:hypothetical protein